jgi:hypothetical protein
LRLPNHYEFLQISANAEPDTIHRVYRFLAVRYHPDHPDGDAEKFFLLKQAYEVLSDPARRATYDAACKAQGLCEDPLSSSIDFMDSMDGELNRRLAVLAVLYHRRRSTPDRPVVSLFELETRMGFPRDYLDFTIWYLQRKGYITRADNADFTITSEGVDFVETERANMPILNKLLTNGAGIYRPTSSEDMERAVAASPLVTPPPANHSTRGDARLKGERRRLNERRGCADRRILADRRTASVVVG